MSKSSLSSVVSNLVRASMGSGVSTEVSDEDLDRHVAELILKEAKQKGDRYSTDGIRAYLNSGTSDSNAPKTNKRFLSSIIRNTDDHNKTILRAQAQAAEQVKQERDEQARRERRARAEEAAAAERARRSTGSSRRHEDDEWDRMADRKRKMRSWDDGKSDEEGELGSEKPSRERSHDSGRRQESSRHRTRRSGGESRDDEGESSHRARHGSDKDRREDKERSSRRPRHDKDRLSSRYRGRDDEEINRHRHRRRSSRDRAASPAHNRDRSSRLDTLVKDEEPRQSSSKHHNSTPLDDEQDRPFKRARSHNSETQPLPRSGRQTTPKTGSSSSRTARSPSADSDMSLSRSPSPQLPSKMDKYFEESYDPRLDVAPLLSTSSAPKVPATGLIDNAEFEGWDAMLELIRAKREDREEKKRLERMGILPKKEKGKKGKVEASAVNDRWMGGSENIMDIEYKKKGAVREWDMGKEGF